jgi:Zn/Cd-binding protein ZinT
MKTKRFFIFGLPVLLLALSLVLTGCSDNNDNGDSIWLADLSNPFIGKWEADIPSANMHLIFDYKTDGTFDYEIPGVSADEGGTGTGAYLVSGNVMVSYLAFEGVTGYTFKVVDNDTIDVTEFEVKEDGSFESGNTAPFTRVAGSSVNKANQPFVLNHPYIGKWNFTGEDMEIPEYNAIFGEGKFDIVTNYEARANGMLAFDFTVSNASTKAVLMSDTDESPYFIFNNVLVVYEAGEGFETGTITPGDSNTIYLTEEGEETPVPLTRIHELAEWAGTWNSIHNYFDDAGLADTLQAQYDGLPEVQKTALNITSFDSYKAFIKQLAETDFGSFVVQGNKITFYAQKTDTKNPSGSGTETVTYTYKGIRKVTWQGEEVDFYAFEGDKASDHKYLIFEEAERDTSDGPLHFHIRYGSESVDSLLTNPAMWAPTIVSYDTTIAELTVFMLGD